MKTHTIGLPILALLSASSTHAAMCDWTLAQTPAPNDNSILYDVSTLGDEMWAVGRTDDYYSQSGYDMLTLALRWDGATWSQIPTPSPGLFDNGGIDAILYAVEVIGPDDVWAGGTFYTQHIDGFVGFQSLSLHWDGSSWTQVETPFTPVGGTGADLQDFVSFAPDDVWAVGTRVYPEAPGFDQVGLTLHWNGSDWTELPVAPIVNEHQGFRAIDAADQNSIWAVGGHGLSAGKDHSYVAHWDGNQWQLDLSVPDPGLQSHLFDIAVLTPDDIWIVGQENIVTPGTRPLFIHYDGSAWTQVIAPSFTHYSGRLEGITAIAPDDIWAVGTYALNDTDSARPLIMHWNGVEWSQVPEDPDGPTFGWFRGIDAVGPCDVVAVGQKSPGLETHIQRTIPAAVPGDINDDGVVNTTDLLALLAAWGACPRCAEDLDDNGVVNTTDLLALLANWT